MTENMKGFAYACRKHDDRNMQGFVYACCPQGELHRVKIAYTCSADPEHYCHTQYGRTLCPLEILCTSSHRNARVAESIYHHLLAMDRIDPNHDLFDLATLREGLSGIERLHRARQMVVDIDDTSDPPVVSRIFLLELELHTSSAPCRVC